jgi:hypothetical protein
MNVRELMSKLQDADPDATVLFLNEHADSDEGEEVREVLMPETNWTREQGIVGNSAYAVHYPGQAELRGPAYRAVVANSERVVVLSSGPTNLRYER